MSKVLTLTFENNNALSLLYGIADSNIIHLEKKLDISINYRGNQLSLSGDEEKILIAEKILNNLYQRACKGQHIEQGELQALINNYINDNSIGGRNMGSDKKETEAVRNETRDPSVIYTPRKIIKPFTKKQAEYIEYLQKDQVIFGAGPAGTGKTYLACCAAVAAFLEGKVEKIILSRPAVEAGEHLGFLPGDMKEKVDPYLRPLYDALHDMLPVERVEKCLESGEIEIAPLAFMRGRTLRHAYVLLDEAQNTTPVQMKMFLTRLGEGSIMAIIGDLSQTDLPRSMKSGFRDALEKISKIDEIKVIKFSNEDVVRHPLTAKIVEAYEKYDDNKWDNKDAD